MIHEGRVGAPPSSTYTSSAPHHPSPYHHAGRHRPSPPGSPATTPANGHRHCCFKPSPLYREPLFCCCYNCPAPTSLFASIGICCLVLGYTLMGAFTFMTLEGGFGSDTSVAASKTATARLESLLGAEIRSRTVDKLWSITEDLNILYKENWTRLAAQEVMEFQDSLVRALRTGSTHGGYLARQGGTMYYHQTHRWTFSSSFLYSLTLITTIGYGSVAPRTPIGKLTTILYAVVGIPLMLVYLSTMGEVLARSFRQLYTRMCGGNVTTVACNRKVPPPRVGTGAPNQPQTQSNHISPIESKLAHYYKDGGAGVILNCGSDLLTTTSSTSSAVERGYSKNHRGKYCTQVVTIPVSLCILIIILYIIGGAVLFNRLENWTLLEGSYFCFTSLGTIGFGDLVPGEHSAMNDEVSHCVCSIYILVGMALIAMCFNLVQDEITMIIRSMGRFCGRDKTAHQDYNSSHFSHHHHYHSDGCEEISMSVVS